MSNFKQVCESSLLENVDWSHQEATISFLEDVENIADKRKSEAIESMVKSIESFIKIGLSEPIQVLLIDCNQDLWGSVFQVYKNVVSIAIEKLNSKSAGFEVSSSQLSTTRRTLLKYSVDVLLKIVKEECNETGILSRLKRVFEMSFKYDGDGVPKLWKPSDDIDAAFATAKEKVFIINID